MKEPLTDAEVLAAVAARADELRRYKTWPAYARTRPRRLYRGVNEDGTGQGTAAKGRGLYSTADREEAATYGARVVAVDVGTYWPQNPLTFEDLNAFETWVQFLVYDVCGCARAPEYRTPLDLVYRALGFDGLQIGPVRCALYLRIPDPPQP